LDKLPQRFIGHFDLSLFAQNLLNAPIAFALTAPAENDSAEGFELGARFVGRQVFEKLESSSLGTGWFIGLLWGRYEKAALRVAGTDYLKP